ncbi:hypothetical protein D9M68_988440 [compost metagenome]
MGPEVTERRRPARAIAQPNTQQQHAQTGRDHGDDGQHLDQRQTKLQLAKHPHVAQVQRCNETNDAQYPDPARRIGKPQPHINAEGRYVSQTHHRHSESEGPAG